MKIRSRPLARLLARLDQIGNDRRGAERSVQVESLESRVLMSAVHAALHPTPVVLAAPTALTAIADSPTSVSVHWKDRNKLATGFAVLRSTGGSHFSQIATVTDPAAVNYVDATAIPSHTYFYEVAEEVGAAVSKPSSRARVSTPPSASEALSATAVGATSVQLNWAMNQPPAKGYVVLRSTNGTNFVSVATVGKVAAYLDTTAAAATQYVYEVRAIGGSKASAASKTVTVTTPPTYSNTNTSALNAATTVNTPPAAPSNLTATAAGSNAVNLAWTDNASTAAGYTISRGTDGVHFTVIAELTGSNLAAYTDKTAVSGTAYDYEVCANENPIGSNQSNVATVTTPLATPASLTATALSPTSVKLTWPAGDPLASGYAILRSTDGVNFAPLATVIGRTTLTCTDTGASSATTYTYELLATNASDASTASKAAVVTTPLLAPTALTAALSGSTVDLAWTDNTPSATAYSVLRSSDGTHFTAIANVIGTAVATYTDTAAVSGQNYTYEVQAVNGTITSPVSNAAAVTTPLAAPVSLVATASAAPSVALSWTDKDPLATGYVILRSDDDTTFKRLATVSGATANSYLDTAVAAGATYYYQVQATSASNNSLASNTTTVATPAANASHDVTVTTRFGDELVVTAAGASDSVSITESGSTLAIIGDGETFSDAAPAAGLFVYTRGGNDSITIAQSVTTRTTIDSIDNARTVINTAGSNVNIWVDSTDTVTGTATVHSVASFAGGVSKALGASLADPSDAGATATQDLSLFGTGPVAADVNQGGSGDCYFLSTLAAFANQDPQVISNSAVDLGDGTYAVQFHSSNGTPVYIRVNDSFTSGNLGGFYYAHPGSNDTIWAAVMEKAFCYFRTGANTYASINSGAMPEVYGDLGVHSTALNPSSLSNATLYALLSNALNSGEAVTVGTQNAPNLVSDHGYTLIGVSQVNGVNMYTVRNPWGVQGDSLENSAGIATLTYSQFVANFVFGTIASL